VPQDIAEMTRLSATQLGIQTSAAGHIARLAYTLAQRNGVDLDPLLSKASLSRAQMDNPNARIQVRSQLRFLDLVSAAMNDDLLGFHLSLHFDLRMAGLLYYVFSSSETLYDALRNGARCSHIVNQSIKLTIHEQRELIGFVFEPVGIPRHLDRHQIEFWAAAVIRACRQITKRHVTARSISFAHRRKPTAELTHFFGSKITFGSAVDEVIFSRAIKGISVISADTYLNDLLVHYCEEAIADQRKRGLFSTSVLNAIAVSLPHGDASMPEVARRLGQGQRTLARRLASEGQTFSGILRKLRIDLANRHLADKDLTISQIAWLLGYQDISAFTSAYKKWTGHAPRTTRRQCD
jgi:AraC-like DNA-binding protein